MFKTEHIQVLLFRKIKGGRGRFYTKNTGVFRPEVDIYAFMHDRCQDGVRVSTLPLALLRSGWYGGEN